MEKQLTGGPHRGDALAGSPNPHHHPVVNHLCSIIHKGAWFSTEDEEELRLIEASMDAVDFNVDYEGDPITAESVTPIIPQEDCDDEDFRRAVMKICEGYSDIFSRQVKKTPANVSPMHIECDVSRWNTRLNRTG